MTSKGLSRDFQLKIEQKFKFYSLMNSYFCPAIAY